jgi:glycosyltransferase involved in cell wall biosynthesis
LRSIGAFQRALDASVVSFVERRDLPHHALAMPPDRLALVACRRLPGAGHFLIPERGALQAARRLLDAADLVSSHSFYIFHPAWVEEICRRRGLPYWLVPHGILDPYVRRRNRVVKQLYMSVVGRRCLANAAATDFSTRNERDKALQTVRVANPVVINWPVDLPAAFDRDAARAALRDRLGIPPECNVLLYLGRLHPMKRPLETIRFFAAATDGSWHMLLVGHPDGVSEEECRREAALCDVAARVHVIPGLEAAAVRTVIQGCDLYVSYSFRENFNNAAAECLANGLPILLSPGNDLLADIGPSPAVGTLSESAADAVTTLNAWASMAAAERFDRGRAGRTWAEANLSFEVFRDRLLELRRETVALHA